MTAYEKYEQPQMKVVVTPNKQVLGKTFKRQAKAVQETLEQMQVCLCLTFRIRSQLYMVVLALFPLPSQHALCPPARSN